MGKEKIVLGTEGVYDARKLGVPKMLVLGFQHTFAMFGATVLVPILTGINVSTALLFAGLGTLLFHLLTKGKVPAFLGSSFAFLGGYAAVAPLGADGTPSEMLPYAAGGVVVAGFIYVVLAALIKVFGVKRIMRFFPPVVTGPIIIAIGLILAPSAITNCQSNWLLAFIALAIIVVCNIWGKGMVKILPILIGIVGSYIVALLMGEVNFDAIRQADWFGLAIHTGSMAKFSVSACITIAPIALATMMEHIGDIAAISATCERPYLADPGLHRTLLGDGLATSMAALFGAPANTTYGENTGVLALTRVFDPVVIRIAAVLAILFSFSPKFATLVSCMPAGTIGGVSLILYGMISAVGVRNVVENRVDFTKTRNVIIAALIMSLSLGITFSNDGALILGAVRLSGLAVGALVGIFLNAVLPGNDYRFGTNEQGDESVNFKV